MLKRIRINAKIIVAFQDNEHRVLRDGCVVIDGSEIQHVGKDYDGTVDAVVDAGDRVVTPGFINTHCHMAGSPLD
ncbi:MAG TPA: amidohydrolase, partial [Dehalococcoidia bacterium]|nr:amidohydrolase [Dehalococcoidia bacterium]